MARNEDRRSIRCSFCGKPESQVRKMIAGPHGVYICDECVDICSEIVSEELKDDDGVQTDDEDFELRKKMKNNSGNNISEDNNIHS